MARVEAPVPANLGKGQALEEAAQSTLMLAHPNDVPEGADSRVHPESTSRQTAAEKGCKEERKLRVATEEEKQVDETLTLSERSTSRGSGGAEVDDSDEELARVLEKSRMLAEQEASLRRERERVGDEEDVMARVLEESRKAQEEMDLEYRELQKVGNAPCQRQTQGSVVVHLRRNASWVLQGISQRCRLQR